MRVKESTGLCWKFVLRIFLQNFQNETRVVLIQENVYMSDPG